MTTPLSVGHGTHLPALIKAVMASDGPILELGTGLFSTPFLHYACYENKRELVSYDNEIDYYEFNKPFENDYHKVIFVEDWDKIDLSKHWSVALVDHHPGSRRRFEIARLANNVDYVIVHDTQPRSGSRYKYSRVFPLFKYRRDFGREKPLTTVLSNFKDLKNL